MKKLVSLFLLSLSCSAFSQTTSGAGLLAYESFYFQVFSDGTLRDFSKTDTAFKPLLYSNHLWVQGLDSQFQIYLAGQTYGDDRPDYIPGPISNDPNATTKYDRVWVVTSQMIADFVNNPGATIPDAILEWPAHGNTAQGEAANLAPFVDVDNDNLYDPQSGDYPCIPGERAIFFIFNDVNGLSTDMSIEVHGMAYTKTGGGYLDSTFFIDYKIYNRSPQTYVNVRLGVFSDFDLGGPGDDVMGTDVNNNAIYGYNGDGFDSQPGVGFGSSLASAAMVWLKGPAAEYFDGIDNDRDGCVDGIRDPITGNCIVEDPTNGINEHWQMINSITYDALAVPPVQPENDPLMFTHMLRGDCYNGSPKRLGNGGGGIWSNFNDPFNCSSIPDPVVDFVYTGNTFDLTGTTKPVMDLNWYQNPSDGGDIRTFAGCGDFRLDNIQPVELSIAYVWNQADTVQSFVDAGLGSLLNKVSKIQSNYDPQNNAFSNCKSFNVGLPEQQAQLFDYYYSPSTNSIVLINKSTLSFTIQAYNTTGQKLTEIDLPANSSVTTDVSSYSKGVWVLRETQGRQAVKLMVH